MLHQHEIVWENSKVITTNNRYGQRPCLEAWHINMSNHMKWYIQHIFLYWKLIKCPHGILNNNNVLRTLGVYTSNAEGEKVRIF